MSEISLPTLNPGENYTDLIADKSSFEDFNTSEYFDGKGFAFVKLNQLALEHLLAVN